MEPINNTQLLAQMQATQAFAESNPVSSSGETAGGEFASLLKQAVDSVNQNLHQAGELKTAFELGDPNINIAEVMIASQKANVSFQAALQVRNKFVSAYQEIMNMQI